MTIKGIDNVIANMEKALRQAEAKTSDAIRKAGDTCEAIAKLNSRVSKNPPEGHIHMRDRIEHIPHPLKSTIISDAPYSIYNEFGTSRMSAAPFMRPGFIAGQKILLDELKGIF